jgi:hypothetical protein
MSEWLRGRKGVKGRVESSEVKKEEEVRVIRRGV